MAKQDKPVAKSLHTITVLYQVARYLADQNGEDFDAAMHEATRILGLAGRDDPYGLVAKADAQLGKLGK